MYIFKKVLTKAFYFVLVCLLLMPVGLLYIISRNEQLQYQAETVPVVEELAYGDVVPIVRRDITETITISGTIVSASVFFAELNVSDPYNLRFLVAIGDVLHPGDVIAYDGSRKILSDCRGVIREIDLGTAPYLRMDSLDDFALECYVNSTQRAILERESLKLTDENGSRLTVLKVDDICTDENLTRVLIKYDTDGLRYGQTFSELTLTTGKVYTQALVVNAECVYRKAGSDSYFLRTVTQDGHFLSEAEVQIGYTDGTYICISGVEEGSFCDSGYKTLVEN